MRAFILAGGFATRLWPLTEKRAKPLLPLAGKPIIEHAIAQIPEELPIAVSTNAAFGNAFTEWKAGMERGNISVVVEETSSDDEKIGALGAVAQWLERGNIDEDILLITGDNYFGFAIEEFLRAYKTGTPLLAAYDIGEKSLAKSFGTVILKKGTGIIQAFEEKPANPQTTLVSTGCSILPRQALPTLKVFAKTHPDNIGGIFEEFLRQNQTVESFVFTEPWFDIGSFHAYLEATKALIGEKLQLEKGATFTRSRHQGSVLIGRQSAVQESALKNVVIFPNCTIEDCILEDCIIDAGSTLKGVDLNGKMLREETVLTRK
jgi:glucose-1-phosphate thymidylyltransferase